MKRLIVFSVIFLSSLQMFAQEKFPVQLFSSAADKPFIFFISGDGGMKGFTLSLCKAIRDRGFTIASLDARAYFWNKKSPEQTETEIAAYVADQLKSGNNNRRWVMVGYSFGADITPFVVNRLPDSLKSRLSQVVLLSPSTSTDFEVHLSDMLGIGKKRSMDVIAEINRLGKQPTVLFSGEDETEFPFNQISLSTYTHQVIKGGHHFDGKYEDVADKIAGVSR
ncbi:MAG: virulence factor family protein [Chitinophagaceae bacterium]|nr:MAG: virulence factor family protein [Chitinophagaceae bacterium]